MSVQDWVPYAQIGFWVVMVILGALTYVGAKKSLFQPIRTEVFKEQIKVSNQILEQFVGRGLCDLWVQEGLFQLIRLNWTILLNKYAECFFDVKRDSQSPMHTLGIYWMRPGTPVVMLDDHYINDKKAQEGVLVDPRVRFARWAERKVHQLALPDQTVNMERQRRRLAASPILPTRLVRLMEDYESELKKVFPALANVLEEKAKEMPLKYGTIEELDRASMNWIHNACSQVFPNLEVPAARLMKEFRAYFRTDEVFGSGNEK